ncbi:MAG: hypothetical protein WCD18_06035 [Thermosynechococcaceae cyanobacterium]
MKALQAGVLFLVTTVVVVTTAPYQTLGAVGSTVINSGACSDQSLASWTMKATLKAPNKIKLNVTIDSAIPGSVWTVALTQIPPGSSPFLNRKFTVNADGNIIINVTRPDNPGIDNFTLHATARAGQVCDGSISL